jgi:hypothetical protein
VGSATLNTAQQVGGSIGTALLNTVAAGAATSYLVGRTVNPANVRAAAVHSYTTAFLWSSLIFVAGAVVAGLVLQRGGLASLAPEYRITTTADTGVDEEPQPEIRRVPIACR